LLTRDVLIDRIWGSDYFGDTKTLDVHIKRLRSHVEEDPSSPKLITTIRGVGYRFDAPATDRRPNAGAQGGPGWQPSGQARVLTPERR
jgi:DNA-binding winged helix-turn-helix (wHTH) protein